ncbi:hypothetical protein SAMN04489856_102511, partial [Oleiphilus messinensis]
MLKAIAPAALLLVSSAVSAVSVDIKNAPFDRTPVPSIYNEDYVDIPGEKRREHGDLTQDYSLAVEPKTRRSMLSAEPGRQTLSATGSSVAEQTGCPNLDFGSGLSLTFSAQGQFACVSTLVETETKIEGLLLNIPAEVNYDLFLFKHDENGLTQLDASFQANAAVEKTFAKVQPGAYVLVAQATQGASADPVVFGWQGYTQIDSQEANDKVSQSTSLQTNAVIQGNLDNTNDLDFFSYTVEPDQVKLNLRFSASEQFVLETWSGSSWVQLPNNQLGAYSVTPNTTVNFLVRATADNPPPASAQYSLVAHNSGSAESVTDFKAWNNENLTKLLVQSGKLYDLDIQQLKTASIEAHDNINFSGTVRDSDNNPVPLTSVSVKIETSGSGSLDTVILLADENGYFNGSVPLKGDECSAARDPINV